MAPHAGWPWSLMIDGVPTGHFGWEDVDQALRELQEDPNSFLVLEQKDPADPKNHYWYIQCAVDTKGPSAGYCTVGCGFSGPDGRKESRKYYERQLSWVGDVIPLFRTVWQGGALDLSQFTDRADFLF